MKILNFIFRGNLLLTRDRYCRWLMCQVGNEVPVISLCCSAQEVAACWEKAKGAGIEAAVFSCCSELYMKRNTWPSSETLMCHWNSVNTLCCGCGDKQFYGLLPSSSDLDINTELSPCSWHCGVPPPNNTKSSPCPTSSSDLRSSGLSPGNWHCLNSQGICRIIKFFQSFLKVCFVFFLFCV